MTQKQRDERCNYPWHPTHEKNLVAKERTAGGELRTYRCPVCGAESFASIADEIPVYG